MQNLNNELHYKGVFTFFTKNNFGDILTMKRFTAYRHDMDEHHATHNENQKNPEGEPQYEGVIFSDGSCALRWLTLAKSTSIWADFKTAMLVHGHPEYGTEIVFHDEAEPLPWEEES